MMIRKDDNGDWVVDETSCSASYVWWGVPPYTVTEITEIATGRVVQVAQEYGDDDPAWITSFCVEQADHEGRHRDVNDVEFDAGEERGGVG